MTGDPVTPAPMVERGRRRPTDEVVHRLFVAVDLDQGASEHLANVVASLKVSQANEPGRSTRVAPPDRWHITVAFLGDVTARRLPKVRRAIVEAISAGNGQKPIALRISGGGTFGAGRFTIMWAGVAGEVERLHELATALRQALHRVRLPVDLKAFRPHLTLARPGERLDGESVRADIATLDSYEGPLWSVTELYLIASEQGPTPRYTTIESFPLSS